MSSIAEVERGIREVKRGHWWSLGGSVELGSGLYSAPCVTAPKGAIALNTENHPVEVHHLLDCYATGRSVRFRASNLLAYEPAIVTGISVVFSGSFGQCEGGHKRGVITVAFAFGEERDTV